MRQLGGATALLLLLSEEHSFMDGHITDETKHFQMQVCLTCLLIFPNRFMLDFRLDSLTTVDSYFKANY